MRAIGFRADSDSVHWAVVEDDSGNPTLIESDCINAPKIGTEAESLSYLRTRVLAVIQRLNPRVSMIRFPEPSRPKAKHIIAADKRIRVEGVILEATQTAGVPAHTGAMSSLARRLGSKKPKAYLDAANVRGVEFPNKNPGSKEAVLAAVAALTEGL